MSEAVSAWVPPTRSLAGVLREAMAPGPELRLLVGTTVDGGNLPAQAKAFGHVSFNGGPPVLVPALRQAIPFTSGAGGSWHTVPGYTAYVLAWEAGTMLAIGYMDTEAP